MAKNKTYIVTRKHTLNHKIGDEIELNEQQAKNLTGKIRLKDEAVIDGVDPDAATKAEELELANKELALDLETSIQKLSEANEKILALEAKGRRVKKAS